MGPWASLRVDHVNDIASVGSVLAAAQARRAMTWLCGLIAMQGVVGVVQYETHLPTELVWVHVALASLSWLCVLWAIATIGPPDPGRARKHAQIRASLVQPHP